MLTLTLAVIKANARKAHAEGRLIAQQPAPTELCWQNPEGHVCALGASFPVGWNPDGDLKRLTDEGEVSVDDLPSALHIIHVHDGWALGFNTEQEFLDAVAA